MRPKPGKVTPNAQDLAAANISLNLVQVLIDLLIARQVIDANQIADVLREMERYYAAPGNPARHEIRSAAAEFLRKTLPKYDVPPESQRH